MVVIDTMCVNCFVDPGLEVEIFWKGGGKRIMGHWFWNKDQQTCKFFMQSLSNFLLFFWWQKFLFLKALLTCTFILWLLNSFDLLSYRSESNKRYILSQMCLERGECWRLLCQVRGKWLSWEEGYVWNWDWGVGGSYPSRYLPAQS